MVKTLLVKRLPAASKISCDHISYDIEPKPMGLFSHIDHRMFNLETFSKVPYGTNSDVDVAGSVELAWIMNAIDGLQTVEEAVYFTSRPITKKQLDACRQALIDLYSMSKMDVDIDSYLGALDPVFKCKDKLEGSTEKLGFQWCVELFVDFPRFEKLKKDAKDPGAPLIPDLVPVTSDVLVSDVSHAAAIAHQLRHNDKCAVFFKHMIENCADVEWNDIADRLSMILKAGQGIKRGKMGAVRDLSESEYRNYQECERANNVVVGPYLLIKLAQQYGALMKIEDSGYTLTRNNTTIEVISSFEVSGDTETFSSGIVHGGKRVKYSSIPTSAYMLAEIVHRKRKLVSGEGKLMVFADYSQKELDDAALNVQPRAYALERKVKVKKDKGEVTELHSTPLGEVVNDICVAFNKTKTPSTDVDIVIDVLARVCIDYLVPAKMENYVPSMQVLAKGCLNMFDKVAESCSKLTNLAKRMDAITQVVPVVSAADSLDMLKNERKHRNCTDYLQYTYKNIGSVGGSLASPAVDTTLKGARIKEHLNMLNVKPDDVTLFGVAYAHMASQLTDDGQVPRLFDAQPAKCGPYAINQCNVYDFDKVMVKDKVHCLVVDDTNTGHNISKENAVKFNISAGFSGDYNKIRKFVSNPSSKTIVSKIHLETIKDSDAAIQNMLFAEQRPFKYAGIFKYGKLHNPECFIVLSNYGGDDFKFPPSNRDTWKKQCASILLAMNASNMFLSKMRVNGFSSASMTRAAVDEMWMKLISVLPVNWKWYDVVRKKCVKNGSSVSAGIPLEFKDDDIVEDWGHFYDK